MKERKIGFELHRASRSVKRYMDKDASKSYAEKITGTHGWVIGYLYNNRHRDIFQRDFESEFNIRRSTASKILSLMEDNGLIIRKSVEKDARLKKIILTPKACEVHAMVEKAFDNMEEMLKENISDEELEIFFRVIDKVTDNIERREREND